MKFKLSNQWEGEMVERVEDLPDLTNCSTLFLDLETATTGINREDILHAEEEGDDTKRGGVWPYLGDTIAGIAVTADTLPNSWYIPFGHKDSPWNLPEEAAKGWLERHLLKVPRWVNHNIKFDAHFAYKATGVAYEGKLIDTLTLAKCFDSDRMQHKLKDLCREWCELNMRGEAFVHSFLKSESTKDFAVVPADILGAYACEDVQGNRVLYHYLQENMPEGLERVCRTEVDMTTVLFNMERRGMQVNRTELRSEYAKSLHKLLIAHQGINDAIGFEYTDSAKSNAEVFLNQMELPVLGYTEVGNPSFDKDAMAQYKSHPEVLAHPEKEELVLSIDAFRTEKHFKSLFLQNYLLFCDPEGFIHPSYNQVVRTGRMSCREPNFQQLNYRAKLLVHPRPGCAFLSFDASQIEFRLIIHYIKDETTIRAYHKDPRTDFHAWVAKLCEVKRSPAKTLNFAMGYGAGKRTVTANLRNNEDIIKEIANKVNAMVDSGEIPAKLRETVFNKFCTEHADYVYNTYHRRFPGLRVMTQRSTRNCRIRGWVKNAFGRRRHLPREFAHKAFNAVVQGCAMDYIKDRMVVLEHDAQLKRWGVYMLANVHDEVLFEGPIEVMKRPEVQAYILGILQTDPIGFRIPLRWDGGYSEVTWAEASKDEDALLDVLSLERLATKLYGWDPCLRTFDDN